MYSLFKSLLHISCVRFQYRCKSNLSCIESEKPSKQCTYLIFLLQKCARLQSLSWGMQIHARIICCGATENVNINSNLVAMYAKCGGSQKAYQVFEKMRTKNRDCFSWNVVIADCVSNQRWNHALELYLRMRSCGLHPDCFTFPCIIKACTAVGSARIALQIHAEIVKAGVFSHAFVGSALVNLYARCQRIRDAREVFDEVPERDVVSWNAMIAGYCHAGRCWDALKMFKEMKWVGMKVDWATIPAVVSACGQFAAIELGRAIHSYIIECGFDSDVAVSNAMIDMYSRCGSLDAAVKVFESCVTSNVVTWTAMIAGYGLHGKGKSALNLYEKMQQQGMLPNSITFTAILSACCHSGLVKEGWDLFSHMKCRYQVSPYMEHYACMVDLLGRSGRFSEANDLIQSMPVQPEASVWGSLLSACRMHGQVQLAEHAAHWLFSLEPKNAANYVALASIYAEAEMWDKVAKVRMLMKQRGVIKKPGCSWIEIKGKTHIFYRGNKTHPHTSKIHECLNDLYEKIKELGYVEDTSCLPYNISKEDKLLILRYHSEKLAIAFGLISTPPGTSLRIMKNLRVCNDCHTVIKFISRISRREIIVRDALRFHHFNNGMCSCGDYW